MSVEFSIHDLYMRRLTLRSDKHAESLPLLRFEDHLLRRFGMAELIRPDSAAPGEMHVRSLADEIWILLEGQVEFAWRDLREGSPTVGSDDRLLCDEPTLVLAPFGVAFGYRPLSGPVTLLRFATHGEAEDEDIRVLPWEIA
jgi:dTDP-4-dehydrorhamnose 3,5-epimerase